MTATPRPEVPVAVTAFSAKDLERQQINSGQDLNGLVPSLSISTGSTLRSNWPIVWSRRPSWTS